MMCIRRAKGSGIISNRRWYGLEEGEEIKDRFKPGIIILLIYVATLR